MELGGRGIAVDEITDGELGGQDDAGHAAVGFSEQRHHALLPHMRSLI